ncbi:MAG: putative manganese transporter [Vicinamibacterales bacterium]
MSFAALAFEALWDVLPMVPVLLVLYTALELLSHWQGFRLLTRSKLSDAFGPVAGAVLGVIPQCGVSVFMTSLFLSGRVSTGTLLATYLATSDEAIPVLLARGGTGRVLVVLVCIKIAVGAVAGLLVDAAGIVPTAVEPVESRSWLRVHVETEMHQTAWLRALWHGLRRTLEICVWVFVLTFALGWLIDRVGLTRIALQAARHPYIELVATALFGLLPNCSASIAIAEAYLSGVLSFGATVAGLCAGAGYGPILLLRTSVLPTAARILALCLFFSLLAGLLARALALTP